MKPHHLELFYYVATAGGISAAVRRIPYSVQQPAISEQMTELEGELGVTLFVRKPFRLTPPGERLFAHIRPCFDGLPRLEEEIRRRDRPVLRVAAPELILRRYIPDVAQELQQVDAPIVFAPRAGTQRQIDAWLRNDEIDVGIAATDGRPRGLHSESIVRLEPVLLVPASNPIRSAAELWARKEIPDALILSEQADSLCRVFRAGLDTMGIRWPVTISPSSTALVPWFVERGDGIGVTVRHPGYESHPNVRMLALPGFEPVELAILWRDAENDLVKRLLAVLMRHARMARSELAR